MLHILEKYGLTRIVRVCLGWIFIVLGLAGLVLPVLQGVLFLAIGALLLAPYVPLFRRIKVKLYRKFPKVRRAVEKLKRAAHARLQRKPRLLQDDASE